jgi:hypothetical protein
MLKKAASVVLLRMAHHESQRQPKNDKSDLEV